MSEDRRHNKQNREWAREILKRAALILDQNELKAGIRRFTKMVMDDHAAEAVPPPPLKPRPALPARGDFLKMAVPATAQQEPGHHFSDDEIRNGFHWTTLQYLTLPKNIRDLMRSHALNRGHTHMAVYIRSANDIKIGNFDYYNDPDHVIKCLTELVQDGLGPVVFLLDDEGRAFNKDLEGVKDAWDSILKWDHLCSILVPGLECDEYWDEGVRSYMFEWLRNLLPDAYIAAHYTSDKYYLYPEMDGILWQFAPWKHDANDKDIEPRRNGHDNFADEIFKTGKLVGHSREWASPARQAIADSIDFIAGEWTQLPTDGEKWGIEQSEDIERALLKVFEGDKSKVGLMNGAVKK